MVLESIFWLFVGVVCVVISLLAIMHLKTDTPERTEELTEWRLQSMMRWFTAFWPDSSKPKSKKNG